ncbi:MAG: hypothetical protein Kow00109_01250 [Acidobacteriota bacterium]
MQPYLAAAVQTAFENPKHRRDMKRNTERVLRLIEETVEGYHPFGAVRLLVFPEFAHAAPVYLTRKELLAKLAVEIPNEHTQRVVEKARELGVLVQMGSMLECDPKYPGAVFNTACLVSGEGILYKYRKVYPWLPWEVHTSPHDIADYEEEVFPVAETEIGNIGTAICYDWLFPEVLRELGARGAEVLIRVSAYMDPWGATPPQDWWTVVNRCRALENLCYVIAANQGADRRQYPPFSWPGGSMIVDFDGRIVAQASPGPGEKVVVGEVDVRRLREVRSERLGHVMPAHLRRGLHRYLSKAAYEGGSLVGDGDLAPGRLADRVREAKRRLGWD